MGILLVLVAEGKSKNLLRMEKNGMANWRKIIVIRSFNVNTAKLRVIEMVDICWI